MEITQIVKRGAVDLAIDLPENAVEAFGMYFALLEERGRNINLTAITVQEDVARLHFLDSIAPLAAVEFKNKSVIDIGSGAGFPGVPLKVAEPSIKLTLLDSTGKRIDFLSELCTALGINAECVNMRAEEAAHTINMRERFDIAISRAVARLNVLCELCLPFLCVGGIFLAMKGIESEQELEEAQGAIRVLGAEIEKVWDYLIPETDIYHRLIVIHKVSSSPVGYPRRFAKIQNNPIRK